MEGEKRSFTDLPGVFASAIASGIKAQGFDLSYISVPQAVASAATFTRNKFRAAPIIVTADHLKKDNLKAVIINSGNANAATGEAGIQAARTSAEHAAKLLSLRPTEVGVCSTGIIGVPLPLAKLLSGLDILLQNPRKQDGSNVARAIMTTDKVSKEVFLERDFGGVKVHVAGIAKGSGMIAPNMGTMLAFLVTDVELSSEELREHLSCAVEDSFNMISVDGDTSTNDTVLAFSTGQRKLDAQHSGAFRELLLQACQMLAKMIARDGEGATQLLEICVSGALSKHDAKKIAHCIINSPLVKTALTGADPNWGRVVAAAGRDTSTTLDPCRVTVCFGEIQVVSGGVATAFDRSNVSREMKADPFRISLDLGLGSHAATAWGCNLTYGYIDENVQYS